MQNPNGETSVSSLSTFSPSTEEQEGENEVNSDNEAIYEQIRVQFIQLNSLTNMVESLQFQVKQFQETIRSRKQFSKKKKYY